MTTAQELWNLMQPVWEAWPECKPPHPIYFDGDWSLIDPNTADMRLIEVEHATDLCIAAMVKALAAHARDMRDERAEGAHLIISDESNVHGFFAYLNRYDDSGEYFDDDSDECNLVEPTLIEALARTCLAARPQEVKTPPVKGETENE